MKKSIFIKNLQLIYKIAPKQVILSLILNFIMIISPILFTVCTAYVIGESANIVKNGVSGQNFIEFWQSHHWLFFIVIIMIILATLTDSIEMVTRFVSDTLSDKLRANLKKSLMDKISSHRGLFIFEDPTSAKNLTLITKGIERLREFVDLTIYVTKGFLSIVIIGFFLFQVIWWLPLVMILATIPAMFYGYKLDYQSFRIEEKFVEDTRKMSIYEKILTDYSFAKDIRVYDYKKSMIDRWKQHYLIMITAMINFRSKASFIMILLAIISGLGTIIPLFYLIYGVSIGLVNIGALALVTGFIFQIRTALADIIACYSRLLGAVMASEPLFNLIESSDNIVDGNKPIRQIESISFDNVGFHYPKNSKMVLNDISLNFEKGKSYTIVGLNGSGKTTLIKLLMRFYDPSKGQILVNNEPLNEFMLDDYLSLISTVFQDFARFPLLLKNNINIKANDKMLNELMEKFELRLDLSDNLDKACEDGQDISGGQWQKLAIMRAYYKTMVNNVDLVVLDEPTSALDPMIEFEIFNHFKMLAKDKIAIFISHRLAMAKNSDHIIVIDNGNIVEQGGHDELMAQNGKYKQMFENQVSAYN